MEVKVNLEDPFLVVIVLRYDDFNTNQNTIAVFENSIWLYF